MQVSAALLLTVLLIGAVSSGPTSPHDEGTEETTVAPKTSNLLYRTSAAAVESTNTITEESKDSTTTVIPSKTPSRTSDPLFDGHVKPFLNPKDMLLQEIHALEEESTDSKIQDAVAQTLKAESQRFRHNLRTSTTSRPTTAKAVHGVNDTAEDSAMKKLVEAEDLPYEDDLDEDEDEEDENDDEYDDDSSDDDFDDEEEIMIQCPDYCKCKRQFAAATTATCSKLVDEQSFGTSIAHLCIENAGEIRLGPHALRSRGLQQLESITIIDTRILELDQTAFDGITYLFSVNLTRNGLQDMHPNTFQNNTQLRQLAISGNPLKHMQDAKIGKHGLFDARSVTEFDFSNNGLTKLKRTAFMKMPILSYINLKGNRLKEIESSIFNSLDSLVEVDLSNNLLSDIPIDLLYNKEVQTLRVSGNNLTSLTNIRAPKLTVLDASNNKIKVITKDDLAGVPLLDQLTVSSNGLKRIHQHAFADLVQLTYLDISNNKLTSLTEHHLRTNSRLQIVLMSNNPGLETLPIFKPSDLEYETYSIYRFECANCGLYTLEKDTFSSMPALTRLILGNNRLTGLPSGLLSRLTSLRVLDLSDNIIGTIENNMFRGATSLTKLTLAGNPLRTLQVTPFLDAPSLSRLDVSRCALERVWTEARDPLNSLRFMSVRENLLRRITVEELRATPKISGLDLSHNPLDCDDEFREAVQWLTDHGIHPTETLGYASNYGISDDYSESDGISQWTDLAKTVCHSVSDGPPPRPVPHKDIKLKILLNGLKGPESADPLLKNDLDCDEDLLKLQFDHGVKQNEDVESAWTTQDQEYEDFQTAQTLEYRPWYSGTMWPVITVIIVTLMILLLTAHIAVHLARRRGRGPVLRPPMMLRPGLIDNKNCGLVYKPLQEEIATPHMPKRGSFYSSSTFHYDKIVPESV